VNLVLPTISTAAAGEWRIRVKPDWAEVLAIATVSAAESGERKSAVISAVTAPLEDVEEELRGELGPEIRGAQRAAKLAADRVAELRRLAVKAKNPQDRATAREEYDEASAELDAMFVPSEPRWLAGDSTPEALLRLLDENGGALGAFSAEGGFFDQLGRYSDSPQLDGVLQGISGDTIRVDRQNRDPLYIRHPTLSAGLCTQPGRLAELGRDPLFRSSGLLARFGFVLPAPRVGSRKIDTDPVPADVAGRWSDAITRLARRAHELKTARLENTAAGVRMERLELTLSREAQDVLRLYRAELEPQLKATGDLGPIRDWGSKSAGFAVRIAAALTLLRDPGAERIEAAEMVSGVVLVKAYVPHVIAAFGAVAGPDDEINRAIEVLNWLVGNGDDNVSIDEVRKSIRRRAWVKNAQQPATAVREAVNTLAEYGHIRVVEQRGKTGRPSATVWLHPQHRR
jgi:replicative DNA helicase